MADYSFVRGKNDDIEGVWLRDPALAKDSMALVFLLTKEGIPEHVRVMIVAGNYRVVPNTYSDTGGCFVMWGSTLVPGERATTLTLPQASGESGAITGSLGEEKPFQAGKQKKNNLLKYMFGAIAVSLVSVALVLLVLSTPKSPSISGGAKPGEQSNGKTIIGLWERRTTETTEQLNFKDDGSYTVEAKQNSTNEIIADNSGTFTYDKNTINYVDKDKNEFTENYYLSQGGDLLVINNITNKPWERIK